MFDRSQNRKEVLGDLHCFPQTLCKFPYATKASVYLSGLRKNDDVRSDRHVSFNGNMSAREQCTIEEERKPFACFNLTAKAKVHHEGEEL